MPQAILKPRRMETRRENSKANGDAASAEVDIANGDTKPENIISISKEAAGGGVIELDAIPHVGMAVEEIGGMETSTNVGNGVAIESIE